MWMHWYDTPTVAQLQQKQVDMVGQPLAVIGIQNDAPVKYRLMYSTHQSIRGACDCVCVCV